LKMEIEILNIHTARSDKIGVLNVQHVLKLIECLDQSIHWK